MLMKKLYWIDDNFSAMFDVVRNSFPELWEVDKEEGIANYIRILGNEYLQDDHPILYNDRDEMVCREAVKDYFYEVCKDCDQIDEEKKSFVKHKKLIEDPVKMVFKSSDDEAKRTIYQNLLTWVNFEVEDYDNDKKKQMEDLVKALDMDPAAVVGIDILIWKEDDEKIENGKLIFSLALCNYLTNDGYKCFLYSSDADDYDLVENCKAIYRKCFPGSEIVSIFLRADLTKKGDVDAINEIKGMFLN
jgi:hypothetical protein